MLATTASPHEAEQSNEAAFSAFTALIANPSTARTIGQIDLWSRSIAEDSQNATRCWKSGALASLAWATGLGEPGSTCEGRACFVMLPLYEAPRQPDRCLYVMCLYGREMIARITRHWPPHSVSMRHGLDDVSACCCDVGRSEPRTPRLAPSCLMKLVPALLFSHDCGGRSIESSGASSEDDAKFSADFPRFDCLAAWWFVRLATWLLSNGLVFATCTFLCLPLQLGRGLTAANRRGQRCPLQRRRRA